MEIENANYPIPDPEWDYFGTWQHLQEGKSQIERLLLAMTQMEYATDFSDKIVTEQLTKILHHLQGACDFMPRNN